MNRPPIRVHLKLAGKIVRILIFDGEFVEDIRGTPRGTSFGPTSLDDHAQLEVRQIAEDLAAILDVLWPMSWHALRTGGAGA